MHASSICSEEIRSWLIFFFLVSNMILYPWKSSSFKELYLISDVLLFNRSVMPDSLLPYGLQHARLPCPHCLLEFVQTHVHWVSDAIQPSHLLSPSSPPALKLSQHQSFPTSQLFTWGGQSIGASASAPVLPMNIQGWSLGWTDLISLLSKGISRLFSSTKVRKHQFFSAQPSWWWILTSMDDCWKNHSFDYMDLCRQSDVSAF